MESKVPEWFLSFYESVFSAQLHTVRQLKSPKPKKSKRKEDEGMSNMNMTIDILRRAQRPLHISQIIAQVKAKYGVTLDRESLVSALVKKVHRRQGVSRSAPNTFEIEAEGR
jgi:hypothetical protein